MKRPWILTLALSAPLFAQPKTLLQAPLGDTDGNTMSLSILEVAPGATIPSHSHKGPIFAYILEGDIENQVEPNPPTVYHPGDVFHEPAMHIHKVLRNLSATKPAKLLLLHNTDADPKALFRHKLTTTVNQQVSIVTITASPGSSAAQAHQHPGPVIGYVSKGEIENYVDPDPPKVYHTGEVFFEAPLHAHRSFRNMSKTEPAEVVIFEVTEIGQPLGMAVTAQAAPPPPAVPPGMMPYVAILDPQFIPASQAAFMHDDDVLIGVANSNTAKAFPAADLTQHGSVNDQMPDGPVEVTWCGVCNTGAVFRAEYKGSLLHFDYDSMVGGNEVHKDRETGSRWQQSTGEAIEGPLKGSVLDLYPFVRTTWKEWRRRYPNTVVLKPLPGYDERMPNINNRIRASVSGEGDAPKTAFGHDTRLRPKEVIAGLQVGKESKAFPFPALRVARVVNDSVDGVPIVVVHQPSSDTTTAFDARAKGRTLKFRAKDDEATRLEDLDTHSTWDAYGLCLAGRLKGTQLKPLVLIPEFWFAWSEFHPQTKVFTAPSQR